MIPRNLGISQLDLSLRLLSLNKVCHHVYYHSRSNIKSTSRSNDLRKAIDQGNIQQAQSVYNAMISTKQRVNRDSLRQLIMLARHGKQHTNNIEFINQVIKDMKSHLKLKPTHFEYHALMYAYGLQKLPEKALEVVDRMRTEAGLQPTIYTYNTLLSCYKRTNSAKEAQSLFNDMTVKPDIVTYNTMLHLLLRKRDFDSVFKLYDRMLSDEHVKPDVYTYSTLLDAAIISKDHNQIGLNIYYQLTHQVKPRDIDLNILNNMIRFIAKVDYNEALDLYYELDIKYPHIKPDRITFNILLDVCLKNGNPSKAYMIFGDMKKKARIQPDIITYGTLIGADKDNLKSSLELFQDMCSASIEPTSRILNSLMNMASVKTASAKDLDDLVALTQKYRHKLDVDTKAYNTLMHGLALSGRSKQAQQLYDTVFRNSPTNKPDVATFTHLILAYINDDQIDDALEIYTTLREHHKKCKAQEPVKIPIQLDTTFYSTLISSLSKNIGNKDTITSDEEDSSPRLITAMTMFNDMRRLQIQPTVHTYTAMLHACGQYRDRYVLDHVHQLIKVDLYLDPDIAIYNALMDAYNRTCDGDAVLDIWQAISVPSSYLQPDSTSVSILFDSCGHNGLGYRAPPIWSWLKRVNFELNTNNYNSYIECLCRERGRTGWDMAYQLVEKEMSLPNKPLRGKPAIDEKTINTLVSFARKKEFSHVEIKALEEWKSNLFP
jgi:pentatricopeptide repeat protein